MGRFLRFLFLGLLALLVGALAEERNVSCRPRSEKAAEAEVVEKKGVDWVQGV